MDENKRKKAIEVHYRIQPCCRLCTHAEFICRRDFGDCTLHEYDHLKHKGGRRMSIHITGYCPSFQLSAEKSSPLGRYLDLLYERGEGT